MYTVVATITFRSGTSVLQASSGASITLDTNIPNCNGTIIKKTGGIFKGQHIVFNNGFIEEDAHNAHNISGTLQPAAATIILDGHKTYHGLKGKSLQGILVSNGDNRIEGDIQLGQNIVFTDSTASLTCALLRSLSQNIALNGGTLFLEENLDFIDGKRISGSGTIKANKRRVSFGSQQLPWDASIYFDGANDLAFNSDFIIATTLTFSGSSVINGHGHHLVFGADGHIMIERGSTLELYNLEVQNIAQNSIILLDSASKLVLHDYIVRWW